MARSSLAPVLLLAAAALMLKQFTFVPSPSQVARTEMQQAQAAVVAASVSGLTAMPQAAFAARVTC